MTLVSAAALLVGCGAVFDPASRVTSTRILAVSADKPYAAPGETVQLQALGHDPAGRALTWAFATCTNPPSSTPMSCLASVSPSSIQIGTATTYSLRLADDVISSLPPEARGAAGVGVAVVACAGTIRIASGVVPVECVDPSGRVLPLAEFDIGVKRIFARSRDRNANPAIDQVTWDGVAWPDGEIKDVNACASETNAWDDCDGEKHRIAIATTHESFESGVDELGVSFREDLLAQYYSTEGIFEFPLRRADSPETGFVARKPGSSIELWFVVRDNRGGATWTSRIVRAR